MSGRRGAGQAWPRWAEVTSRCRPAEPEQASPGRRGNRRRLAGGGAGATGVLRRLPEVAEHLAEVELQRPTLSLDPFELVLEDLVGLLGLFELHAKLTRSRLSGVRCGFDARAELRKLAFGGLRPLPRVRELLLKLLGLRVRTRSPFGFPPTLGLRQ